MSLILWNNNILKDRIHIYNKNTVIYEMVCPVCKKTYMFKMSIDAETKLFEDLCKDDGRSCIQDVLKDFSPAARESLISGLCKDCQKRIFGNDSNCSK